MTTAVQRAADVFAQLNEQDQNFAMDFLLRLEQSQQMERQLNNIAYLNKVQRAIDQIAQGGGVVREIIEVEDNLC